jgi:hypothetical protein
MSLAMLPTMRRRRPRAADCPRTITRDDGWLGRVLAGELPSAIAAREERDPRTVMAGIERALARVRANAGSVAELLRQLAGE